MTRDIYRYTFQPDVSHTEVESTLVLALLAVESLHGEAQTRLDTGHAFDEKSLVLVIDGTTVVGMDLNRLFTGFASREFGPESFQVQRAEKSRNSETVSP